VQLVRCRIAGGRAGAGGDATSFTLRTLINDGLMALFFFVVGMEIKRELVVSELDSVAQGELAGDRASGRDGSAGRHFPRLQLGKTWPAGLGNPDGDGHRVLHRLCIAS